jgi:hypothetical protein
MTWVSLQVADIKAAIETQVTAGKFRKDSLQIVYKGKVRALCCQRVMRGRCHAVMWPSHAEMDRRRLDD